MVSSVRQLHSILPSLFSTNSNADRPPGRAYQVDVTSHEGIEAAVNAQIAEFNRRFDVFVADIVIPGTLSAALAVKSRTTATSWRRTSTASFTRRWCAASSISGKK